jgi:hypothetical protein
MYLGRILGLTEKHHGLNNLLGMREITISYYNMRRSPPPSSRRVLVCTQLY